MMIVMKKYLYLAFILLMFSVCGSAYAQELDPTVVVNRAYEGKLVEVSKPSFDMMVPDSVTRFDLDFDYTVFEKRPSGAASRRAVPGG